MCRRHSEPAMILTKSTKKRTHRLSLTSTNTYNTRSISAVNYQQNCYNRERENAILYGFYGTVIISSMLKRKQKSDNDSTFLRHIRTQAKEKKRKIVRAFDVMWSEMSFTLLPNSRYFFGTEGTSAHTSHGQGAAMMVAIRNFNMENDTKRNERTRGRTWDRKHIKMYAQHIYSPFYDLNVLDLFFLSNWNSVAEQSFCALLCFTTLACDIFGVTFQFYGFFRFSLVSPFHILFYCFCFLQRNNNNQNFSPILSVIFWVYYIS